MQEGKLIDWAPTFVNLFTLPSSDLAVKPVKLPNTLPCLPNLDLVSVPRSSLLLSLVSTTSKLQVGFHFICFYLCCFLSTIANMASKENGEILSIHELQNRNGSEEQDQKIASTKGGTAEDAHDMARMGRVQELRVCATHCFRSGGIANSICSATSSSSVLWGL